MWSEKQLFEPRGGRDAFGPLPARHHREPDRRLQRPLVVGQWPRSRHRGRSSLCGARPPGRRSGMGAARRRARRCGGSRGRGSPSPGWRAVRHRRTHPAARLDDGPAVDNSDRVAVVGDGDELDHPVGPADRELRGRTELNGRHRWPLVDGGVGVAHGTAPAVGSMTGRRAESFLGADLVGVEDPDPLPDLRGLGSFEGAGADELVAVGCSIAVPRGSRPQRQQAITAWAIGRSPGARGPVVEDRLVRCCRSSGRRPTGAGRHVNGGTPSSTAMRASFRLARSTRARSVGEQLRHLEIHAAGQRPPAKPSRRHTGRHPLRLSFAGLFGGEALAGGRSTELGHPTGTGDLGGVADRAAAATRRGAPTSSGPRPRPSPPLDL